MEKSINKDYNSDEWYGGTATYYDSYSRSDGVTVIRFDVSDDFDWDAFVSDAQEVPEFKKMRTIGDEILILGANGTMEFTFAYGDEKLCLAIKNLPENVLQIGQKVDSYDSLIEFMNSYFEG